MDIRPEGYALLSAMGVTQRHPRGKGSVSILDFATRKVEATWPIPGGGSPDMGNVSADGKHLWLSGRYDDVVYRFDTDATGLPAMPFRPDPARLERLGQLGGLRE